MIERKIIQQRIKEYLVEDYVSSTLTRVGHSHTKLSRSPLGERITIYASRPGLIVGNKGSNIKKLTKILKAKFNLENPQIEIEEIRNLYLDPKLVAEGIASALERFGTNKFKGVGYKAMDNAMKAGALGIEILISGKLPSSRAKRWRFYMGYLKKSGDLAVEKVLTAYDTSKIKTGVVGIQVRIMPPNVVLPDKITLKDIAVEVKAEDEGKHAVNVAEEAKVEAAQVEDTVNLKKIKSKAKKPKKADADKKEVAEEKAETPTTE